MAGPNRGPAEEPEGFQKCSRCPQLTPAPGMATCVSCRDRRAVQKRSERARGAVLQDRDLNAPGEPQLGKRKRQAMVRLALSSRAR
jgi:hypothetical protein